MGVLARVWPTEKNVGGIHRTGRYVLAPVLIALGIGILSGWLSVPLGVVEPLVGVAAVSGGVVSFVEAHTQKCPGYAVMGVDTCELSVQHAPVGHEESS
jgi:hypothetical protein